MAIETFEFQDGSRYELDLSNPEHKQWMEKKAASFSQKKEKPFGQKAIEFIEPTVEALGAVGGGAAGFASPVPGGAAIGAGLGYAGARSGINLLKEVLGYQQAPTVTEALTRGAKDFLVGGSMEAGVKSLLLPSQKAHHGLGTNSIAHLILFVQVDHRTSWIGTPSRL